MRNNIRFKTFQENANRLLQSRRFGQILTQTESLLKTIPGLRKLTVIPEYISLLRDYLRGAYTGIGKVQLVLIAAGLLYIVTPADLIPDFHCAIGFLDDIAVMEYVALATRGELKKYKAWRKLHPMAEAPEAEKPLIVIEGEAVEL